MAEHGFNPSPGVETPVSIANGGTGASTAAAAVAALGADPALRLQTNFTAAAPAPTAAQSRKALWTNYGADNQAWVMPDDEETLVLEYRNLTTSKTQTFAPPTGESLYLLESDVMTALAANEKVVCSSQAIGDGFVASRIQTAADAWSWFITPVAGTWAEETP